MSDWLQIARNQAEERFRSIPFPTGKDENYRFTPVEYRGGEGRTGDANPAPPSMAQLDSEEQGLLMVDGEDATAIGNTPGSIFTDLLRATTMGSETLRTHLRREGELFRDDKFAQLTSARWRNGAFLHVSAGVKLAKPLRLLQVARNADEHVRNVFVVEDGAEATLVQECWSDEGDRFVGELTEVRLGKGAKLNWVVLQAYGSGTTLMARQRVELADGASLVHSPLHLGGRLVQVRQQTHLAGDSSSIETEAAARGEGAQHFDFWVDARHEGPRSRSKMDYRFVMAGKSRGVFNAQIDVKHGVSDCESAQRSRSLLLGSAVVHAIPRLLIATDAVKAAHGASVSSVNFEQLHYLQSRGIPVSEAERMIVRGFTEAVVERLPTETLRGRADAALDRKQGGAHG